MKVPHHTDKNFTTDRAENITSKRLNNAFRIISYSKYRELLQANKTCLGCRRKI